MMIAAKLGCATALVPALATFLILPPS